MMIKEFEQVALSVDLPEGGLVAGDVGTVVDITPNGRQVTVEFFNFARDTIAVVPMSIDHVRPLHAHEVLHAREVKIG
jgi:hypothetical protein